MASPSTSPTRRKMDVSPVFDKFGNRIGVRRYTGKVLDYRNRLQDSGQLGTGGLHSKLLIVLTKLPSVPQTLAHLSCELWIFSQNAKHTSATAQSQAKRPKEDGTCHNTSKKSSNFVVFDSSTDSAKPISILRQPQTPIVARTIQPVASQTAKDWVRLSFWLWNFVSKTFTELGARSYRLFAIQMAMKLFKFSPNRQRVTMVSNLTMKMTLQKLFSRVTMKEGSSCLIRQRRSTWSPQSEWRPSIQKPSTSVLFATSGLSDQLSFYGIPEYTRGRNHINARPAHSALLERTIS